MKNHHPTMDSHVMFLDHGINASGKFCTRCGFRIENPIHQMIEEDEKEEWEEIKKFMEKK